MGLGAGADPPITMAGVQFLEGTKKVAGACPHNPRPKAAIRGLQAVPLQAVGVGLALPSMQSAPRFANLHPGLPLY